MTRDQQRLADYLAHIIEAIERIDRYTEDMDEVAFLNNEGYPDLSVFLASEPACDILA